jgi:geranylgeranyl pyrophosphate synthase
MLTLPYIYTINNLENGTKKNILSKLKFLHKKNDIKEIKKIIINSGGIKYTKEKIKYYSNKAINELNVFKNSKYKDLLIEAVKFNMERKI